jgi:hypothetical protein
MAAGASLLLLEAAAALSRACFIAEESPSAGGWLGDASTVQAAKVSLTPKEEAACLAAKVQALWAAQSDTALLVMTACASASASVADTAPVCTRPEAAGTIAEEAASVPDWDWDATELA